jgi:hypothetical protein
MCQFFYLTLIILLKIQNNAKLNTEYINKRDNIKFYLMISL